MEFDALLEARRSVRSYDGTKKVTKDQLQDIIEAALQAPSWKNSETARYYCVLDEEKVKEFRENCLPEMNIKKTLGASYVVTTFVSEISGFNADKTPTNECGNGWGYYDLGLHNANFIMKARELGLDTLIMGIRDEKEIRRMLNIPADEIIVAVIAIGYGAETPKKPRRKTVEEITAFF